jgi:hypothetical protein
VGDGGNPEGRQPRQPRLLRGRASRVESFRVDDWDTVALDERDVYVVFDNDVMMKLAVHRALESLAAMLRARALSSGSSTCPTTVKLGVDDFLAAGGTNEELYRFAQVELRPPPEPVKPKRLSALHTFHLLELMTQLLPRFLVFGATTPASRSAFSSTQSLVAQLDDFPELMSLRVRSRSIGSSLVRLLIEIGIARSRIVSGSAPTSIPASTFGQNTGKNSGTPSAEPRMTLDRARFPAFSTPAAPRPCPTCS